MLDIDMSASVKEEPVHPSVASGMGYSESKWVAECILDFASKKTPLQPISIRVGQLTGHASGVWSQAEWFPLLVRTSQSLRCLPRLGKVRYSTFSV